MSSSEDPEVTNCRICDDRVTLEESFPYPTGGRDCTPCWRVTKLEAFASYQMPHFFKMPFEIAYAILMEK